jgi:phosphatidylserine/phosphatidylglycerophosphate/cardiolipin synthase-like enzyme
MDLSSSAPVQGDADLEDLEAQPTQPGRLKVWYFHARRAPQMPRDVDDEDEEEPVHTHVKLTIVDGRFTVLGSGNMDRASWYTSQELGVLFESQDVATQAEKAVKAILLDGRLESVFDSDREA